MRIFFLLCCLGAAISLTAQSSNPDKIVAYFSFDNCRITDDSGNGSIGTFLGDTTCVCGIGDTAVRFNGTTDGMLLVGPFKDIFTTSDFTISFYIKPAPPSGPTSGATQVIMSRQGTCDTRDAFWVKYAPSSGKITSSISENDTLIATVQASLDQAQCWDFVTIVRDNARYSIYINGVLRDSKSSKVRLDLTSSAPFKISEPLCPLDKPFNGDLDELHFFNKALTTDDQAKYYVRPDQILTDDTLIYLGNSFQVATSRTCAQSLFWQPSTGVSDVNIGNPVLTPTASGTYTVTFEYTDKFCLGTDTIHITVIDPDTLDCTKIFIPNAFTPGASPGRNDRFNISNPFSVDEFISFEIFDRWGGRVFDAVSEFDSWDGSFQGQPLNPGVLLYRLRYKCNGAEKVKTGSLTLLR